MQPLFESVSPAFKMLPYTLYKSSKQTSVVAHFAEVKGEYAEQKCNEIIRFFMKRM